MIDIDALTRDELLELLARVWQKLTVTRESLPLWEWQREELDRRLDQMERDGLLGIPAEEVLARLRGRNER